ncbi:hypothetical protein ACQCSX_14595 [Pseudarthrobacter sp. P1]|uniref:hypothetical protein n=1 Tax=Pseudarthrobacter sp. P1 TaxID=3418418 RepID=UPI003CEE1B59
MWALAALAAAALAWFIVRCRSHEAPAVDLRLFSVNSFTVAAVGMGVFYVGFAIMLLGGSLFLTHVWGWNPLLAGAGFAIGPATAVASALAAGRSTLDSRWLAGLGSLAFAATGLLWSASLASGAFSIPAFFAGLVATGARAGIAQTGFLAGGSSQLPADAYATGTGILNMSRQIGGAIGIALLVATTGTSADAASYQPAWILMGTAGLLGAVAAVVLPRRSTSAKQTAA